MATVKKESQHQSFLRPEGRRHPALNLRYGLKTDGATVSSMALSPDGHALALGCSGSLEIWDLDSGKPLSQVARATSVICLAWSPDGKMLAGGGFNRSVYLWNATTGRRFGILGEHLDMVSGVAWSPDGRKLASCSGDQTIRVWNLSRGFPRLELKGHTDRVEGVAWSPDGKVLCSGSCDKTVRLWNAETCAMLAKLHVSLHHWPRMVP